MHAPAASPARPKGGADLRPKGGVDARLSAGHARLSAGHAHLSAGHAHLSAGFAAYKAQRYAAAEAHCTDAIRLLRRQSDRDADTLLMRARLVRGLARCKARAPDWAHLALVDLDLVLTAFKGAGQQDQEHALYCRCMLGECKAALGLVHDAQEDAKGVMKVTPPGSPFHTRASRLLQTCQDARAREAAARGAR